MRRPRRAMAEINVVPYIDVMLVLLIIFMVAAPLINPGPDRPAAGRRRSSTRRWRRSRCACAPTASSRSWTARQSPDELHRAARTSWCEFIREAQQANPDQAVVIAGDRNARYEEVLKVLDLLQQNQVKRVGLLARPATP